MVMAGKISYVPIRKQNKSYGCVHQQKHLPRGSGFLLATSMLPAQIFFRMASVWEISIKMAARISLSGRAGGKRQQIAHNQIGISTPLTLEKIVLTCTCRTQTSMEGTM